MIKHWIWAGAAALALASCNDRDAGAPANGTVAGVQGAKTLAEGLGDHGQFAEAVRAAGLEEALGGPTPYTVLVPTDAAFDNLPAGAVDTLMSPEGRKELTAVLSAHILPGTMLAADIGQAIDRGGGKVQIATLGGGTLTATRKGQAIVLADAAGTTATVTRPDGVRSNGVVHEIDAVLMPTD